MSLPAPMDAAAESAARWEDTMRQFDDRAAAGGADPRGGIVFVGSSTFTRWRLADYFRPSSDLVNRGFGGSQLWEVAHFARRIMLPLAPQGIFLYAGDNDLAAGRTSEQVAESFDDFVTAIDEVDPHVPIVFVSIKPSPAREHLRPQMRRANELVRERIAADAVAGVAGGGMVAGAAGAAGGGGRLRYLDIHESMLDEHDRPREELYFEDRLHLSHEGYVLWAELFAEELERLRRGRDG